MRGATTKVFEISAGETTSKDRIVFIAIAEQPYP